MAKIMAKKAKRCKITIDRELCKGCTMCISLCPKNLITTSSKLNRKGYFPAEYMEMEEKENHACTGCTICAIVCPDVAIEVYRE